MLRRAFLTILICGLGAVLYWNHRLQSQLGVDADFQASQAAQISQLEAIIERETSRDVGNLSSDLKRIRDLKGELEDQERVTDEAKQRLLDAQSDFAHDAPPGELQDDVKKEQAYIADLRDQLNAIRSQEGGAGSQGSADDDQPQAQQPSAAASLDAQIQSERATIQQTVQNINQYKGRIDYLGRQQLAQYVNQFQAQRTALQQLEAQLHSVNAQWGAQRAYDRAQSQTQQRGIKRSEKEIRQTLQQEQSNLQALRKQLDSRQAGRKSRQDMILALRADYQANLSKQQQLQQELAAERSRVAKNLSPAGNAPAQAQHP